MTFTVLFWLLVVIFTRLANFLVIEIDKLDLDASGFTTCCVVEMTWLNMPDSYKNLRRTLPGPTDTSTEQIGYVPGLVGPYISRMSDYRARCTSVGDCMNELSISVSVLRYADCFYQAHPGPLCDATAFSARLVFSFPA